VTVVVRPEKRPSRLVRLKAAKDGSLPVQAALDELAGRGGGTVRLPLPSGAYDFMVTDLHDVGLVGSCSLFSTMLEFTDHEAAQVAANAVADALFQAEEPPPAPVVSRRQLLGG
jgi:[NiFe] hydrogenase assembly HybE family chaperone